MFARQAQAAIVRNTTDMGVDVAAIRDQFPAVPATTWTRSSVSGLPAAATRPR
jgi:hypothetical protein